MYTIGQVSKKTKVAISTLRYYDEIGLLKPAKITESGYRYYSDEELIALQHIIAFKELGFTLTRIKKLLATGEHATEKALKSHYELQLTAIAEERKRLDRLEKLLLTAKNALEMKGKVDPDDIFLFIQAVQSPPGIREEFLARHFSDSEIRIIKSLPDLGSDDPRTANWVRLIRAAKEHVHEPPSSENSQKLAEQFVETAMDWFDHNEHLIEKYWELIKPEEGTEANVYGLDREVMEYVDRIVDWYLNHLEE